LSHVRGQTPDLAVADEQVADPCRLRLKRRVTAARSGDVWGQTPDGAEALPSDQDDARRGAVGADDAER
jgi:hypothetical protein